MSARKGLQRLWPGSLFGRLVLIFFCGLAAAHILSFWLVFAERGMATRAMMASYLARDVASSVAILERVPPAERAAWLPRLDRRNYRFEIGGATAGTPSALPMAQQVRAAVSAALKREVAVSETNGSSLRLHLTLADGTPLSIDMTEPRMEVSAWVLAVLAAQLVLLVLLTWFAVRLATRPLARLVDAANALAPGLATQPLPETGSREVAQAAAAFNAMQRRIDTHLAERMRILAAVSHDLQTPITRMRLRAELLDDAILREKLQSDLAAMQALVGEGLAYARSAHSVTEPLARVDLHALLDSLACDYADAGQRVGLQGSAGQTLQTRPQALRRLVANLVDNALKFAGTADIEVSKHGEDGISVEVLDRGPGIPQDQLQAVSQPFYRLESSRNRDTGGTGLGLAIAQQLAQVLGGELTLSNRNGGGLRARLLLPGRPGTQ
ncbi:MAG TPA: ATP-binding protein [Polaromonas sp.]|uniref:ATP-binding protein n=1 Tax=Polaromonas sp. TaxID=1869339 RepID=UPI002D4020B3|nr:ATP-binding protein [Polaromonas sp.]HYW57738.1 ATP-binding protein [Polaromonas sp.]